MSMRPFSITGLDHILLLVDDAARARSFYEDALGCPVVAALPEYAMVQLGAGRSLIDLVDTSADAGAWARPDVEGGRNMDHVAIAITACDRSALAAHLAAHGIEIIEQGVRAGAAGDSWSVYVRDPAGNQIELTLPPDN